MKNNPDKFLCLPSNSDCNGIHDCNEKTTRVMYKRLHTGTSFVFDYVSDLHLAIKYF